MLRTTDAAVSPSSNRPDVSAQMGNEHLHDQPGSGMDAEFEVQPRNMRVDRLRSQTERSSDLPDLLLGHDAAHDLDLARRKPQDAGDPSPRLRRERITSVILASCSATCWDRSGREVFIQVPRILRMPHGTESDQESRRQQVSRLPGPSTPDNWL